MRSATVKAYEYIKNNILSNHYPPSYHLREVALADELLLSRTPIREALLRLITQGYAYKASNGGTYVSNFTSSDIDELFGLRALLEKEVVRLAANRITAADLEKLRQIQDQIEFNGTALGEKNLRRIAKLNQQFHSYIASRCANEYIKARLTSALERPVIRQTFLNYSELDLSHSFFHHRELLRAFVAKDSEWAGAAMECHVRAAHSVLIRSLVKKEK